MSQADRPSVLCTGRSPGGGMEHVANSTPPDGTLTITKQQKLGDLLSVPKIRIADAEIPPAAFLGQVADQMFRAVVGNVFSRLDRFKAIPAKAVEPRFPELLTLKAGTIGAEGMDVVSFAGWVPLDRVEVGHVRSVFLHESFEGTLSSSLREFPFEGPGEVEGPRCERVNPGRYGFQLMLANFVGRFEGWHRMWGKGWEGTGNPSDRRDDL